MLRPTRLLHFDHLDGPNLAKLARSRAQPAQHSHSGPGLARPVPAQAAATRGPRSYGPGPLQTQRALLPCRQSLPGCQAPKEPARVLSPRVGFIGSATEPALLRTSPRVHLSRYGPARLLPSASGSLAPCQPFCISVEPLRVLAFAVALELLPGQVWAAEGLGR